MGLENRTFKAGDYATGLGHTGLLKVTRVMNKRAEIEWLNPETKGFICNDSCLISKLTPATEEEIAVGYKIDPVN